MPNQPKSNMQPTSNAVAHLYCKLTCTESTEGYNRIALIVYKTNNHIPQCVFSMIMAGGQSRECLSNNLCQNPLGFFNHNFFANASWLHLFLTLFALFSIHCFSRSVYMRRTNECSSFLLRLGSPVVNEKR